MTLSGRRYAVIIVDWTFGGITLARRTPSAGMSAPTVHSKTQKLPMTSGNDGGKGTATGRSIEPRARARATAVVVWTPSAAWPRVKRLAPVEMHSMNAEKASPVGSSSPAGLSCSSAGTHCETHANMPPSKAACTSPSIQRRLSAAIRRSAWLIAPSALALPPPPPPALPLPAVFAAAASP